MEKLVPLASWPEVWAMSMAVCFKAESLAFNPSLEQLSAVKISVMMTK
jgi:hypothetical protein